MALDSPMALSVSSSDWSIPPQKNNIQWELWEEKSNSHQAHNSMNDSRANTSSSDWSQYSSEHKYNHRWEQWELEDAESHHIRPEIDESHDPFGNSRAGTPSSDWSPRPSERKYDHHWRHCAMEGSDRDGHFSDPSVDDDYIPPENSRLKSGPSNNGLISRQNSTQPQNQNGQTRPLSKLSSAMRLMLMEARWSGPNRRDQNLMKH